mmetsp:Transcript_46026/g.150727  ORF Transcript_46026/g.150727 Transcript_46026/m.150727 type:complete len:201 (+) Transcript_46026:279-881(+)
MQAEELQRGAVGGRDGLHPLARELGDEEAAPADGDGGRPAVLSRPAAPPPEGAAEESVRGGEDLDAVVEHVRDIHLSAVLDQPVGRLEMAGSGAAARRGARVAAEAEPEGERAGVEGGHRVALCDVEQCGVTLAERQRTRAHEAPLAGAEAADTAHERPSDGGVGSTHAASELIDSIRARVAHKQVLLRPGGPARGHASA